MEREFANGQGVPAGASADEPIRLSLPLDREQICQLEAGQACLLSGPLYTLRDAGHQRLLAEMDAAAAAEAGERSEADAADGGAAARPDAAAVNAASQPGELPYGLSGQTIFYAGPTPSAAGRPFGAIGPTTASRMDFAAPRLLSCGLAATVGKGTRSEEVRQACIDNAAVYFVAVGGAAALLAKCVESCETLAYDDLGTEALRRVVVSDFPVFVGIDVRGGNIYSL